MIKWLAAVLGYMYFRFPGAILGFIIGSLLDNYIRSSGGIFKSIFGDQKQSVSPGDFELNLLSLSSIVIKADGNVSQTGTGLCKSLILFRPTEKSARMLLSELLMK